VGADDVVPPLQNIYTTLSVIKTVTKHLSLCISVSLVDNPFQFIAVTN